MYYDNKILIGMGNDEEINLVPKLANRHGLIAGATGTGKTITLKGLAESFSDLGVPVFLADMKGDISGIALEGQETNSNVSERVEKYNLKDKGFNFKSFPVEFWDLFGEKGLPIRVTISEMGPNLLSKILGLSEVQEGVLNIVFKVADDESLLLIDLKDLKSMINHVADNADKYKQDYGAVSSRSASAIIRALLSLEDQGGNEFFGEPALDINDFIKLANDGRGVINVLDAVKLSLAPELYSTFLLWMLSNLYETLPEVGDLDKPKLVFFFDEAHLLFESISPSLLKKIEQVVRLIRSKGVGLYFISQNPTDIPDNILSQLGNRVQHALHAYTPSDQKAVKVAATTFRPNPDFKTEEVISNLAIGEALVSLLSEDGVPSMVQKVDIVPPQSFLGPIDSASRSSVIANSELHTKYAESFDRESAYECLLNKIEDAEEEPVGVSEKSEDKKIAKSKPKSQSRSQNHKKSSVEKVASSAVNTLTREVTKSIVRGIFGELKKR